MLHFNTESIQICGCCACGVVGNALALSIKSTGGLCLVLGLTEVDAGDDVGEEAHREHAVDLARAQRDGLSLERLGDAERATLEVDRTAALDLAHHIAGAVLDLGQGLGKGGRAGAVAGRRDVELERLVRALMVVDVAPVRERALAIVEIGEAVPGQDLGRERTVEALVLALGLGPWVWGW